MGTSTGYNAPTTPQWAANKNKVTRTALNGLSDNDTAHQIISGFIVANGGAFAVAHGRGALGGSAAPQVARNIAKFVSSVGTLGLRPALEQAGLAEADTKTVSEITLFLVGYLGGSATTIDDVDARNAASRLVAELLENEEFEAIEERLQQVTLGQGFNDLLERYYGYFLYELFCRVYYERLVARVGELQADIYLDGIRDFLGSAVQLEARNRDLSRIDWNSEEGRALSESIFEDTLIVYGG